MTIKILSTLLIGFTVLTTACASPTETPPTPTLPALATSTVISAESPSPLTPSPTTGAFTPIPTLSLTPPPVSSDLCTDPQATALIDSLKTAVTTSNGELLASLVSPTNGMDVRYLHYGTVVNYDQEHAKFLFETTFEVDWGAEPGSGAQKTGSFHDVIVPELMKIFNQPYTLHCNELKHGGASYPVVFPYDKGFYSIYFPGTEANGNLDWRTWVAGIEHVDGKPFLYALMQFFWEP